MNAIPKTAKAAVLVELGKFELGEALETNVQMKGIKIAVVVE